MLIAFSTVSHPVSHYLAGILYHLYWHTPLLLCAAVSARAAAPASSTSKTAAVGLLCESFVLGTAGGGCEAGQAPGHQD